MQLKDFIANTLVAITDGVSEANKNSLRFYLNSKIHANGMSGDSIVFDVQVEVEEGSEIDGNGGINISVLKAGTSVESRLNEKTTHNIKFSVFVADESANKSP